MSKQMLLNHFLLEVFSSTQSAKELILWVKTTCKQRPIFLLSLNSLCWEAECTNVTWKCIFCSSRLMPKPAKWHLHPAKTQISLGVCPVWSESALSAWRKLGSLATHWEHSEDSDQTGGCPGWSESSLCAQVILLVFSRGGSFSL